MPFVDCLSNKCKETGVYTNVNGDIVSYALKTANIKKVILPNNTSPNVNALLSNIVSFDFCCFRCVTHYVIVNISINCSFFTFTFAVLLPI